jgi:hypothetical protein
MIYGDHKIFPSKRILQNHFPTKSLFQKIFFVDHDLSGLGTGATEKFLGKVSRKIPAAHPRRG